MLDYRKVSSQKEPVNDHLKALTLHEMMSQKFVRESIRVSEMFYMSSFEAIFSHAVCE